MERGKTSPTITDRNGGYSNGYRYYHQNEHGDIEYITGKDGKIENAYTYDAFGNITNSAEIVRNRYTYNGEQYDQVTQQYYLRARYYNPLVGRFTQEDVYRGDGLNLYAYCGNNPVMYVDPSGYSEQCGTGSEGGSDVNPNALKYNGDGTWTSNEGLIYGQSQDGNRVIHVLKHTTPDSSKPLHSVYNVDKSNVIGLVDEAWTKRGNGIMQGNGNVCYN